MKARGLRARLALAFAGAVTAAMLVFAGIVVAVVAYNEAHEQPNDPNDEDDSVERVLFAILFASPFVISGAAGLGLWLARTALAPMREASLRVRAARASELDLSLPVSGSADEWDELSQTLNTLLADARVGLKRVHTFTADAAHELKTPLTAILGISQVASRRDREPEEYRRALDEVHDEALRLGRLVEALLTLARADAGILVPQSHRVDLGRLCMDAVARAGRNGDVALRVPDQPACTLGDPVLLGRIVDNLVENALRHGAAPVTLTVSNCGPHVCLEVTDSGRGISPAFAPRLFERFAHGETRSGQGQGLGLAIARAIAVAHRGTLELLSAPGGAHFRLTLPAP